MTELVREIQAMWDKHNRLPPGSNATINRNIEALRAKYDLTYAQWYCWSRVAGRSFR